MQWLRNLVLLVGLAAYIATIGATLIKGEIPEPILLTSIAGLWAVIYPPKLFNRREDD